MNKMIHYRHATSMIEIDGNKILIDPVFAPQGTYPPIVNTKNPVRNPLTDLPVAWQDIMDVDGVIITHNHNDHFDVLAKKAVPKNMPILCQSEDYDAFLELGFMNLTAIEKSCIWLGIEIERFPGTHGGHLFRKKLGVSSSYLLKYGEATLYLSGDTLLTAAVRQNLRRIMPDVIIANGGGARMKLPGKITMSNRDILKLTRLCRNSRIISVHMDAINHCFDTRTKLRKRTGHANLLIPEDGETLLFPGA